MGTVSLDEAVNMFDRAHARFTEQLGSVPDGTVRVPHLVWTIDETAAHVLSIVRGYRDMILGGPSLWPDLAHGSRHNARLVAEVPERGPQRLADAIESAAGPLVAVWRQHAGGTVPWHAGVVLPTASEAAMLANDVLVHGWDVAKALGRRWPISDADSCLAVRAYCDVLPALVDPDAAAGFHAAGELHLRGGPYISLRFDGPKLAMTEGRVPHADFRISARPSAYNLSSLGRISPLRTMLDGSVVAYGRKPWLAAKVGKVFYET